MLRPIFRAAAGGRVDVDAATRDYVDVCDPCWAVLMSVVCATAGDHVEICGL